MCSCFAILLTLISTDFLAPLSPMVIPGGESTQILLVDVRERVQIKIVVVFAVVTIST